LIHGRAQRYTPDIERFLAHGEECGCVEESATDRLPESLELGTGQVEDLRKRLSQRGIEVEDDCGRRGVAPISYADGDLVQHTIDTMGQFLREAARFPLLTAPEEIELAKRIERGDLAAKDKLINHNLRLVVSIAKHYQVTTHMTLLDRLGRSGLRGTACRVRPQLRRARRDRRCRRCVLAR